MTAVGEETTMGMGIKDEEMMKLTKIF